MKPAAFDYHRATTAEEALQHLNEYGYDAKLLAGGQSLVPAMNFRLAQPAVLVDLNPIESLSFVEKTEAGALRIGAMTRQSQVERSPHVAQLAPLLHQAMPHIAHLQIRNRGTMGGSLAHSDPAAELPAVMCALNARFRLLKSDSHRWVAANRFFTGLFATELEVDEMLTEIELPPKPPGTGYSFREMARRHGDYALVGVAVSLAPAPDGSISQARIVFMSVGDTPVEARQAASSLIGQAPGAQTFLEAARVAATEDIAPGSDIHASADFRRHLARELALQALTEAWERAGA